jgi:hypothetical protein
MSASPIRAKIAVVVAIAGGLLFGFLATKFGQTGHPRIVPAGFVFLFIPVVVVLSERLKMLVWQVSVFSFITYFLAWNIRIHKISFDSGGAGLSFLQILFVSWAGSTIFSAPVPFYFFLRRIQPRYRYYALIGATIIGAVLWLIVELITR